MEKSLFFLLLVLVETSIGAFIPNNLALRGIATQSSLAQNPWAPLSDARNAIDGNRNANYNLGSCTATDSQANPWWRVDLLDVYVITSINIVNRGDGSQDKIIGAEIRIGNSLQDNGIYNTLVGVISSIPAGGSFSLSLTKSTQGRYVTVVIPVLDRILTLCEVEVYGFRALTENIALHGRATQSSLGQNPWAPLSDAQNAIDGNRNANYNLGSCTATDWQANPWWRVDLLDVYVITSINIVNRGDAVPERINGAEIRIGNSLQSDGIKNALVGVIPSIPGGGSFTLTLNEITQGRYVTVDLPGPNRLLTLCEVEVYGYLAPTGV